MSEYNLKSTLSEVYAIWPHALGKYFDCILDSTSFPLPTQTFVSLLFFVLTSSFFHSNIGQINSYLSYIGSSPMKITMAAEYAVRCVLYLSRKGKGQLTSKREIAANTDTPEHFLAKIAQDLSRFDIIEIKQGSKGGYSLRNEPKNVTMLDVVEAIIGEITLNECTTRPDVCKSSQNCSASLVWQQARDQVRETLRNADFESLVKEGSCCTSPFGITAKK